MGDIYCRSGRIVPLEQVDVAKDPAKGVVFYVGKLPSGKHGMLVVAAADLSEEKLQWSLVKDRDFPGLEYKNSMGDERYAAYSGRKNTEVIRAAIAKEAGLQGQFPLFEALSEADFKAGWYIPSPAEFRLLYSNMDVLGAAAKVGVKTLDQRYYWTAGVFKQEKSAGSTELVPLLNQAQDIFSKGHFGTGELRKDKQGGRAILCIERAQEDMTNPAPFAVGEGYTFPDGDRGVVFRVESEGTSHTAWVCARKDLGNGQKYAFGKGDYGAEFHVDIESGTFQEIYSATRAKNRDGKAATDAMRAMGAVFPMASTIPAAQHEAGWYIPSAYELVTLYGMNVWIREGFEAVGGEPMVIAGNGNYDADPALALEARYWSSSYSNLFAGWFVNNMFGLDDSTDEPVAANGANRTEGRHRVRLIRKATIRLDAVSGLVAEDDAALRAFYEAMGGKGWHTEWFAKPAAEGWLGLKSQRGYATAMDLAMLPAKGEGKLAKEIGGLRHLARLSASGAGLRTIEKVAWGSESLQEVDLSRNALSFRALRDFGKKPSALRRFAYSPQADFALEKAGEEKLRVPDSYRCEGNTYAWKKDGKAIASATELEYSPRESGEYVCEIRHPDFPDLTLSSTAVIVKKKKPQGEDEKPTGEEKPTAVGDAAGQMLAVSPNPTAHYIRVQGVEEGALVEIYNAQGQLAMRSHLPVGSARLYVGHLPKGGYYLRVGGRSAGFVRQ